MIVFKRKRKERIVIGDNVIIEIVDIQSGSATIGIIAPTWMPVNRQEIFDKKKEKLQKADSAVG